MTSKNLDAKAVVASFDSASVLHAANVAALQRKDFPNLGSSNLAGIGVRVAGRLPWPILRGIYTRIGGAEGIDPDDLARVDLGAVAASFADAYPQKRYPAVFVGASNGALTHLAAALQVPWLPQTVLIPVHRLGDPQRPDQALDFGRRVGPALLEANPDIALHQMHDSAQDELMTSRMTYFRTKWRALPAAYTRFLESALEPGAPVLLIDDQSVWPVVRVGERHVFQSGGRGGLTPQEYLKLPHTPTPDDESPEAEWGTEPLFAAAVREWAASHGHPVVTIRVDGPQEAAHPIAEVLRQWTRDRGGAADRLIVPSFVLGDPWRTIELGRVPFWTFFAVQSAVESLRFHLAHSAPYRAADIMMFQHGADSPGRAKADDFESVLRDAGVEAHLLALARRKIPHDIGSLGRYGAALSREKPAGLPFTPLAVADALGSLASITGERGRTIVESSDLVPLSPR